MQIKQAREINELKEELEREKIKHKTTRKLLNAMSLRNAKAGQYIRELRSKLRAANIDEESSVSDIKIKSEIDDLRTRVEQLECPHVKTRVTLIDDKDAFKLCLSCGKTLARLSKADYLVYLINKFIDEEVSDGNGIIESIQELKDANENLKIAIRGFNEK